MARNSEQISLIDEDAKADDTPVVCLGMTFENDEERRAYFREELRKKLPELRQIEGFPIGEDEDIIALSDPPYYTACPNPWTKEFIKEWESQKQVNTEKTVQSYTLDVVEGKSDPIYNAHSYHTKVPHKAIMHLLLHYTNPGDIVYDGFCGTGMTGVAANLCGDKEEIESIGYKVNDTGDILKEEDGEWIKFSKMGIRNAILNDLSPIATFIASNYNLKSLTSVGEANELLNKVEDSLGAIYVTASPDIDKLTAEKLYDSISTTQSLYSFLEVLKGSYKQGLLKRINYTIFSDIYSCKECTHDFIYWNEAINQENLTVNKEVYCPTCGISFTKKNIERVKKTEYDYLLGKECMEVAREPVLINYFEGTKKKLKKVDALDKLIINKVNEFDVTSWLPTNEIPRGDKTNDPINLGLTNTHHYYTNRNLLVLSKLWEESKSNKTLRLALTSILVKTGSLLHNVGLKNGNINLAGALPNAIYIPSILAERNIFELLRGKLQDIDKADLERITANNLVSCHSTTNVKDVESLENSVDYIFIDPPFGANLMYSELNFIWESWLNVRTNNKDEAIENRTQNKGSTEYHKLMRDSFKTAYLLLKPGKWITIEFSSTKAQVWNIIQQAVQEAGFIIANVSALNKGQGTFNSQTNPTSVKQDLIISAYKPSEESVENISNETNTPKSAWTFVTQHLEKLPIFFGSKGEASIIAERTPRILYDRMVAYHVQNGWSVPISSAEFQAGVAQYFPMRDGMVFLESQIVEYDKKRTLVKEFTQVSLFVSDENSAIEWIRQQLIKKPQTRQDLHPHFMKEIQHIAKHEQLPEIDDLLVQNFLRYEGDTVVPDQIVSYLRRNYREFRGFGNNDEKMKVKAENYWYVPDPNKQADLEKLREKTLLREFNGYLEELTTHKKKLRYFRTEAIRAGFKKAWTEKDYIKIVTVGERLPETVIQEDDKLLMYYDNAQIRIEM